MKKNIKTPNNYGEILSLQKAINVIEEIHESVLAKLETLDVLREEYDLVDSFLSKLGDKQDELMSELLPLQKAHYGI